MNDCLLWIEFIRRCWLKMTCYERHSQHSLTPSDETAWRGCSKCRVPISDSTSGLADWSVGLKGHSTVQVVVKCRVTTCVFVPLLAVWFSSLSCWSDDELLLMTNIFTGGGRLGVVLLVSHLHWPVFPARASRKRKTTRRNVNTHEPIPWKYKKGNVLLKLKILSHKIFEWLPSSWFQMRFSTKIIFLVRNYCSKIKI